MPENEPMTTEKALAWFDRLPPVPAEMMIGRWDGFGVNTGHPMDGLLEVSSWVGKDFKGPDDVAPLVHEVFGIRFHVNPALLPIGLVSALPLRDRIVPVLFPLLAPFLAKRRPRARLRMVEHRGKVSASMIYDAKPIIDVFRKIDENSLLGLMDRKEDTRPYFFKLVKAA